ncbi:S8 family serine peptidase [Neptunitalea lumnitzerae]|uniref:Peptidase S8/S53 domain-containing protein n=1 Tax=Neptunitalea lumnitzerae TaxID=2965509 RepID=A0ABQ5MM70_9FLAO|nr:S8 family serine peptidase [Neptunitalea sp. Y10]GLB50463.1 hypothetical protein Y10_28310 [Neptunitalea sp. Y10]
MDPKLKLTIQGNPNEELHLLLRLRNPDVVPKYVKVVSRFKDIISCRILRKHLLMVYTDDATFSLKAPQVIPVNTAIENTDFDDVELVESLREKGTAQSQKSNVVFGIIDFGFDFTHPNFTDAKGNTRFEKIWVQALKSDEENAYGYGKIIDAEVLNAANATKHPFKVAKYHPGVADFSGRGMHGTHVLGIAASSGKVGRKGYAGDSAIIAVDMGANYVNGSDLSLGDSVKLIEGIDFILKQAGDRPCVINMSLGGHGDAHSGQTLVERALNNALKKRPGLVIVQSTGNYFNANCHHSGKLIQDEVKTLEWIFKNKDKTPNEMEIWYEGDDEFTIEIYDEAYQLVKKMPAFKDMVFNVDETVDAVIFHRKREPNTLKNHINIILTGRPITSKLYVHIIGSKVKNGVYHAYIERDDRGQSHFNKSQIDTNGTTGSICNAPLVITVGAYDQRSAYKNPLSFSSAGPTSDGRMKPEVVAPGSKIMASKSASRFENRASGRLTAKSGSSMAAPYVASLAVKVLESHPTINIYALRQYLFKHCTPYKVLNGNTKNKTGFGAINALALLQSFSKS